MSCLKLTAQCCLICGTLWYVAHVRGTVPRSVHKGVGLVESLIFLVLIFTYACVCKSMYTLVRLCKSNVGRAGGGVLGRECTLFGIGATQFAIRPGVGGLHELGNTAQDLQSTDT